MLLPWRDGNARSRMGDFASALSEVSSEMDGSEQNYS